METERTIYRIVNLDNGKSYVGLTERPVKWRVKDHFDALKKGRHKVEDFQEEFNQNKNGYRIEILQSNVTDSAHAIEKGWMLKFETNKRDFGYNYKDTYFGWKPKKKVMNA